ncbi:MAG: exodeoxyribonuclease VII large subunit, partial [Anaerovoracaceae bacterium]
MALKPITVSQLNRYIGKILSTDPILGNVSVRGEISNLKYHGSGHVYFSLKDAGSKINCFLPASSAGNLRYQLTDGIEAVVSGYLSVYEAGGYYS